ncbi:MAG: patatin-like phospholipase family protein [bacterium]|nr:patatin-like phospholipase family protein [bacterium]
MHFLRSFFQETLIEFLASVVKFVKSSIVSLIVLAFIFFLYTKMGQASILVADLIETSKFSYFLTIFLLFALALSLSHFPIYTYYAAGLNESKKHFKWFEYQLKYLPFVKIRYFEKTPGGDSYKKDLVANFLRYSIGFLVIYSWISISFLAFNVNLQHHSDYSGIIGAVQHSLPILLLVVYAIINYRFEKGKIRNVNRAIKTLTYIFIFLFIAFLVALALIIGGNVFSIAGMWLNFTMLMLLLCIYFLFRLLRTKFNLGFTKPTRKIALPFWKLADFIQQSRNYLSTLSFANGIALIIILHSNWKVVAVNEKDLLNGTPIVLAYLYFYSYLALTIAKYFFIANTKMNVVDKLGNIKDTYVIRKSNGFIFRVATLSLIGLVIFIQTLSKPEQATHQMMEVDRNVNREVTIDEFAKKIESKDTVFVIAAHGGGLKANAWTLRVLQELQRKTKGKLFEHTVVMSGASGGSLGLSLYLALYKEYGNNIEEIDKRINEIIAGNYTSIDLTFMFGSDALRSFYPLRSIEGYTRSYYKMLHYQQYVEGNSTAEANTTGFREFWWEIFEENGGKLEYAPSLVMNTAGINGKRGVLWSVRPNPGEFDYVFPHSVDLAELPSNKTLTYYGATSMTNRFPLFSPSAKVKREGHFIDAGAIDNSGILGCLDVLKYLRYNVNRSQSDENVLAGKHVVLIEIYNSKSIFIQNKLNEWKTDIDGDRHYLGDEDERSTLANDFSGGMNLDKFPGYLEGLMKWAEANLDQFDYVQIPLPHKITVGDIEGVLRGEIDPKYKKHLQMHIDTLVDRVSAVTEEERGIFEEWQYYEPFLARVYNKGAIRYNNDIVRHDLVQEAIEEVKSYLPDRR